MKHRVAIFLSGRGSNMEALVDAARAPDYPAQIVLAFSNQPNAPGLSFATSNGITVAAVDHRPFGNDRAAHESFIQPWLDSARIDVICLAGYMRVLTPQFMQRWAGRVLNIHPSLLPSFPGLHTHARALAVGAKLHGCTVHLATAELDNGPILAQAAVPVLPDDTEDTLAARVLVQEHRIYPLALKHFAAGTEPVFLEETANLANPS